MPVENETRFQPNSDQSLPNQDAMLYERDVWTRVSSEVTRISVSGFPKTPMFQLLQLDPETNTLKEAALVQEQQHRLHNLAITGLSEQEAEAMGKDFYTILSYVEKQHELEEWAQKYPDLEKKFNKYWDVHAAYCQRPLRYDLRLREMLYTYYDIRSEVNRRKEEEVLPHLDDRMKASHRRTQLRNFKVRHDMIHAAGGEHDGSELAEADTIRSILRLPLSASHEQLLQRITDIQPLLEQLYPRIEEQVISATTNRLMDQSSIQE